MSQTPVPEQASADDTLTRAPRNGLTRSVALGGVILIAGLTIGFAAGITFGRTEALRQLRHSNGFSEFMVGHMTRDLSLTPEQACKVGTIVQTRAGRVHQLRASTRPQVSAEIEMMWDEISRVLTDEQRAKLDQRREMFKRFQSGMGQWKSKQRSHGEKANPWGQGYRFKGPTPGAPGKPAGEDSPDDST